MAVFNSDWLLRQVRGTEHVASKVFKLENMAIDLGQVELATGQVVNGNDYIDQLVIHEQYDQATDFIHSRLKHLTTNDYNVLVGVYVDYLKELNPELRRKHQLDDKQIEKIEKRLAEFSW